MVQYTMKSISSTVATIATMKDKIDPQGKANKLTMADLWHRGLLSSSFLFKIQQQQPPL